MVEIGAELGTMLRRRMSISMHLSLNATGRRTSSSDNACLNVLIVTLLATKGSVLLITLPTLATVSLRKLQFNAYSKMRRPVLTRPRQTQS